MFTGIISRKGQVVSLDRQDGGAGKLWVALEPWSKAFELGESIAVDGVCLSVAEIQENQVRFDVLNETFCKTTLGDRLIGDPVNLERALLYGDAMGGHIVSGHVDAVGAIHSINEIGRDWHVTVSCAKDIAEQMIYKGSITINGVSLTLTEVTENSFSVHLIPITKSETNLGDLEKGTGVNLELDILGKYAKRLLNDNSLQEPNFSWDTFKHMQR